MISAMGQEAMVREALLMVLNLYCKAFKDEQVIKVLNQVLEM